MGVGGSDEVARFAKVVAAYQFVLDKKPRNPNAVWEDKESKGKVWVKVHAIAARDASLVPAGQKLWDLICFLEKRPEVEHYEHTHRSSGHTNYHDVWLHIQSSSQAKPLSALQNVQSLASNTLHTIKTIVSVIQEGPHEMVPH
jgi:hypothetical protein